MCAYVRARVCVCVCACVFICVCVSACVHALMFVYVAMCMHIYVCWPFDTRETNCPDDVVVAHFPATSSVPFAPSNVG